MPARCQIDLSYHLLIVKPSMLPGEKSSPGWLCASTTLFSFQAKAAIIQKLQNYMHIYMCRMNMHDYSIIWHFFVWYADCIQVLLMCKCVLKEWPKTVKTHTQSHTHIHTLSLLNSTKAKNCCAPPHTHTRAATGWYFFLLWREVIVGSLVVPLGSPHRLFSASSAVLCVSQLNFGTFYRTLLVAIDSAQQASENTHYCLASKASRQECVCLGQI